MGRRKKTQLTITNREHKIFQCISKTGLITNELAMDKYGVSKNRMDRLTKEGYCEKRSSVINKEVVNYYVLTSKGKNYVKKNVDTVNKFYKFGGPAHDLALATAFSAMPQVAQDLTKTETDLIHDYKLSGRDTELYSPPDFYVPSYTIEVEGVEVANSQIVFEVITKNYTEEQIQAKENFVVDILKIPKEVVVYEKI